MFKSNPKHEQNKSQKETTDNLKLSDDVSQDPDKQF